MNSQKNTIRAYGSLLVKFGGYFPNRELDSISSEKILSFLTGCTDSCKTLTKHTRYAYLQALFNFIRNHLDVQLQNPCDTPIPGSNSELSLVLWEKTRQVSSCTKNSFHLGGAVRQIQGVQRIGNFVVVRIPMPYIVLCGHYRRKAFRL